jgi:hypothetical protein
MGEILNPIDTYTIKKTFEAVCQLGILTEFERKLRSYGKLFEFLAGQHFNKPDFFGVHVNRYRKAWLHLAEPHDFGDDSVPDLIIIDVNLNLIVGLGELKLLSPQNAQVLIQSLRHNPRRTFRQITKGGIVVENDEWGNRYPLRFNPKRARFWFSQINTSHGALAQLYDPLPYFLIVPNDTVSVFKKSREFDYPCLIPGVDNILSVPYPYQQIIDTIDAIV